MVLIPTSSLIFYVNLAHIILTVYILLHSLNCCYNGLLRSKKLIIIYSVVTTLRAIIKSDFIGLLGAITSILMLTSLSRLDLEQSKDI